MPIKTYYIIHETCFIKNASALLFQPDFSDYILSIYNFVEICYYKNGCTAVRGKGVVLYDPDLEFERYD